MIVETDVVERGDDITHHIKGQFTCNSRNIIYLIRCAKNCDDAWYVGETKQTLRGRLIGHRQDITTGKTFKPIGEHFNLPGHSSDDLRVTILQGHIKDTCLRRAIEQKLVDKLNTHKRGLNIDRGCMSHYTLN